MVSSLTRHRKSDLIGTIGSLLLGIHLQYEVPYHDMVPADPSIEDMRKCVCDDNKRPTIPNPWSDSQVNDLHSWMYGNSHRYRFLFQVLREMMRLMRECWASRPDARLTALRVKKSVDALMASFPSGGTKII